VKSEITRIVSKVVAPALRKEIDALRQEQKEYLFAGISVGAEAGIDDYSVLAKTPQAPSGADPMQMAAAKMFGQAAALMDEDKAPRRTLGYCALTNAGYSKTKLPTNIDRALAEVNRSFIEFWDKQFVDSGIPSSRIYTHVAASPPQDEHNNAPLNIVFNVYSRPGWTTYPIGTLANTFRPLYDELSKHGNPAWGGVEANNAAFGNPNPPGWEQYLAWHYNHGAKLVAINVGASDQSLMLSLSKGAYGEDAMSAYKKFLTGGKLTEQ
jgi:hypothetical protein